MTIGIYRLCFMGTDRCYIGQSINIEERYKQHIRSFKTSTAPEKLLNAYRQYGEPKLELLVQCSINDLDSLEAEAIEIFDSFNNGFNSTKYTYSVLKGELHGNSKYTDQNIIEAAILLTDTKNTAQKISELTGISVSVVRSIACLQNHAWLSEVVPEVVDKLKEINGTRTTAAASRKIYPSVKSPLGEVYQDIKHFANFCKEHGLDKSHFTNLLNGKLKSHKGWTLVSRNICVDLTIDPRCGKAKGITYPPVKSPEGTVYSNISNAAEFCRNHSLNKSAFSQLLKGKLKSHKGWTLSNG